MPISLIVVAILFILSGISALVEMLVDLTHGSITLNIGVVGVFVGIGLLFLRPGWRTCALVLVVIWLFFLPIGALCLLFGYANVVRFEFFGVTITHPPKWLVVFVWAVCFAVGAWVYRVLTRPHVRRLFQSTQ